MSLNIKNERTVALVRELAARTGESQTSAVERAVQAQLDSAEPDLATAQRESRNARARAILVDLWSDTTDAERAAVRRAQDDLYDAAGLPQ